MASPFPFTAGQVLTAAELNAIGESLSYTPTYTNMSLGNGTVTASYVLVQNLLSVVVEFEFGSTSTISGNPAISIPSGLSWTNDSGVVGGCRLRDEGVANYLGMVQANPNGMLLVGMGASGTYSSTQIINATNPFTWGATDKIELYATGSVA